MRGATPADVIAGAAQWCVVEGDALVTMASLADGSIDVTLTDPPFDEHTQANIRNGEGTGTANPNAGPIDFKDVECAFDAIDEAQITIIAREFVRLTKRWIVAFTAVEQIGDWKRAAPVEYVRGGVWDKISPTPQLTGDRPGQAVDGVVILHRRGEGRFRWNGGGGSALWRHRRLANNNAIVRTKHPTEKPVPLMREMVEQFTDEGELILDAYAGVGSTGVAALLLGRRVILVEQSAEWCETARQRCEAVVTGTNWRKPEQMALLAR